MPRFKSIPHNISAWRVLHLVEGMEQGFKLPEQISMEINSSRMSMGRDTEDRPYVMIISCCGLRALVDEPEDWIMCDGAGTIAPCTDARFRDRYEPLLSYSDPYYKDGYAHTDSR